jgi:hypothetical protein
MARYTFGAYETDSASPASFEQFVEVVKGRSITSLADFGAGGGFELGLSGNLMVRVLLHPGKEIEVVCFSTQNPNEPPAFSLSLGEMSATVPVWQLDIKLRGLRTAFAILHLLAGGHENELANYLLQHPSASAIWRSNCANIRIPLPPH